MSRRGWLRLVFYLNLLILALVVGYRIYLDVFDAGFESVHAGQVEAIQERLADRDTLHFAVVGNINNSIGIFERQIIPRLNASGVDFVVSAGNAVSDGGEDKYRALRGTLNRLQVPYLLTFGENEAEGFGALRFYRHFGPYFFTFVAGNSRFVFLDTTGETSFDWQLQWLEDRLEAPEPRHTFLFTGLPLRRPEREPLFVDEEDYLGATRFRQRLIDLAERRDVDAVFAAQAPLFDHQTREGVDYVITGGAGGVVLGDEGSFHHFTDVRVEGGDVRIEAERLEVGQNRLLATLESLWLFIHSLFFTGYLNLLLVVSALAAVGVKLYGLVFVEKDYYPPFDVDPAPFLDAPLRVAMFTNNYLPFIGGVPISIDRLRRGLERVGKEVLVVAPDYDGTQEGDAEESAGAGEDDGTEEGGVLRVPSLGFGDADELRLANLLDPRVGRRLRSFAPDLVHLHHPFWLGSLGLWLARRLDVPAIYTYHTRLEHYAHYVPVPGLLFRNLISHYLVRRFANKCSGVVVPTLSAREYLRAIGVKSPIVVQPTGVDRERFRDVDPSAVDALRRRLGIGEERVLISVSRLGKEKNIDFMISAVDGISRRLDVPFRLVVVGEGNERQRLESMVEERGLGDTVLLPGAVPAEEMPVHYHMADAFVFASRTETQGMVVLEAMAAGLPVVAVRSSGIDDLVRNDYNGFKTGEDQEAWGARVLQLLTDDGLRAELSHNALAFADEFDIEPLAREMVEFYADALARRQQERRDD